MDTTPVNRVLIEARVIEALQTVFDPEIPVNIWEVGLIYGITVDPSGAVGVRMTLTSPNCPSAVELPVEVETKVKAVPGVTAVKVDVVFDPPWAPDMMSEAAKLELGML
jgi:FeS assembly SUF system protein